MSPRSSNAVLGMRSYAPLSTTSLWYHTSPAEKTTKTKARNCGMLCANKTVRRAALCQVFDSIFCKPTLQPVMLRIPNEIWLTYLGVDDVPMARVKFNANTEYAYLQNFKILQSISPSTTHFAQPWSIYVSTILVSWLTRYFPQISSQNTPSTDPYR